LHVIHTIRIISNLPLAGCPNVFFRVLRYQKCYLIRAQFHRTADGDQMNVYPTMVVSLFILASLLSTSAAADTGTKISNSSLITAAVNPVILKNEVLLNRDSTNYTEVRHIVLKGTNEQIGKALGEISKEYYNARPIRFVDPVYAKAHQIYMQKNYPAFYERMKGVAEAYNVSLSSTDLDLSVLPYDAGSLGCSVVYFPPSVTYNGHSMACRNMDYVTVPLDVVLGKNASNQTGMFARAYVLELYPDEGYSSLVIGGHDLLGTFFQGINSQGLAIELLEDDSPLIVMIPPGGARSSGLSEMLAARMVLDTCKSIEEAKVAMLNNRIYFPFAGNHFLIYDQYGNSTIAEFSAKDDSVHFTDGSNSIRVMTNHPVSIYPTVDSFPKPDANASYYDTFLRYKTLTNITSNHKGKFTLQDMIDTLRSVYAEKDDQVLFKDRSLEVDMPERTTTNSLLDLTNGTISARFYLRDGPTDPMLGGPSNVFSQFFNFTLREL